jgi:MFS family permease
VSADQKAQRNQAPWRELFRDSPGLGSVLVTDALATLAELASAVVVPWWITTLGGTAAIAAYGIALAAATLIVVPAVSPFGDRFCKASQMRNGLAGLAVVSFALAWCSTRTFALLPVMALVLAKVLARAFVEPAQSAILPELVAPPKLPQAIRLQKTCRAISGVLGPMLAGALLSLAGVPPTMAACAALTSLAAISALLIPRARGKQVGIRMRDWWQDLRIGARAKWGVPMERGWTIVNFVVWIFQGPAVGILIPIKVHALGLTGNWLGVAIGALSVGVLVGSFIGSSLLVRRFGRYRVRIGLGCLEGVCLALVGFATSPYAMAAGLVLAGFCNASMALVGATHRALAIPKSYRVRMLASGSVSTQVAGAIGPALVGVALARWSVPVVYATFGALMASSVLGFLLVPRFKEFLTLEHEHIEDWYALQYPHVFV